jgi:hypothetical protein
MRYAYAASFLLGLLLGVRAMLNGVERPAKTRTPLDPTGAPGRRFALNLPTAAGFATAFGLTGYLLARFTDLGVPLDLIFALIAGVAGAVGVLLLIAAWAIPAAKADVPDERYLMQGALARVIGITDHGASGTVTYTSGGVSHTTRATALDGSPLEVGSEVVIERIENGVAFVEPWARVEARL